MTDSFYVVPTLGAVVSTSAGDVTAEQLAALKKAQLKQKAQRARQAAKGRAVALAGTGSEGYYLGNGPEGFSLAGLSAATSFGLLAAAIGIMWFSGRNL